MENGNAFFLFVFLGRLQQTLTLFFSLVNNSTTVWFSVKTTWFDTEPLTKVSFSKVRLPCNNSDGEQQQKTQNLQVLKEAGVYTVVEAGGFFFFLYIFPCPSLCRMIGIGVAHLFGREGLQRLMGDCCPEGGCVMEFFSLAAVKHPLPESGPHFLSLLSWSRAARASRA